MAASRRILFVCVLLLCSARLPAQVVDRGRELDELTRAEAGRTYVSVNFLLELDGVGCGFVKSVEGGGISAEVIQERMAGVRFVTKHLGPPVCNPVTIQLGFSMARNVYDWIAGTLTQDQPPRRNVAIIACDPNLNAVSRMEYSDCLITEVRIPACDGSSKEPAYLGLTFQPETAQARRASGKMDGESGRNEQKVWLPSSFRLTINGLDTSRVNKIEEIQIWSPALPDDTADQRDRPHIPGLLEFRPFTVVFAEASAPSWTQWHRSFVVEGKNDQSQEKGGELVFLTPNRQGELARLTFRNLGIYRLSNEKAEANAEQIRRMRADLYCERMEFSINTKPVKQ